MAIGDPRPGWMKIPFNPGGACPQCGYCPTCGRKQQPPHGTYPWMHSEAEYDLLRTIQDEAHGEKKIQGRNEAIMDRAVKLVRSKQGRPKGLEKEE